jgi:hypothetical protein
MLRKKQYSAKLSLDTSSSKSHHKLDDVSK